MKKLLALLLAVVMLLSFAACSKDDDDDEDGGKSSKGGSVEDAVETMEDVWNGDMDRLSDMIPDSVLDMRKEQIEDFDAYWEDLKNTHKENFESELEEFGDDAKVTITIESQEDMDDEDVEAIAESLNETYKIDTDDVKTACTLTLEMKAEGSDGEDSFLQDYTAVQVGNSWYIVDYYEYDGNVEVSFLV